MSRSNPTDGMKNPSTRWFEWAGGDDGGIVKWYDRETKETHKLPLPFTFLLLDELATVKGWHEPSQSGIYSNEVRDTRQEVLVVKSFNGGEMASGLYADIKEKVVFKGGGYHSSIYIAYKDGEELRIGNLSLGGAALSAWMDFKKRAATKKDASGKSLKAYFIDAVTITGYNEAKKGKIVYRTPTFALKEVSPATNQQAIALDAELQAFLSDYLKRPKADAAKPDPMTDEPEFAPEEREPIQFGAKPDHFEDRESIPF
jgi:hypothetical protein